MARQWTCRKCSTVNPRTTQRCECGRKRPAASKPKHRDVLDRPYEWWVAEFGEACGICGALPKPGKRLHRDHDHRGEGESAARGLACFRCNSALRAYMTVEWLRQALAYLECYEARLRRGVARGV